jgi:hypothetical protein
MKEGGTMRRSLVTLTGAVAAAAALAPSPALSAQPSPRPNVRLSIEASPSLITWGTQAGIGGRMTGNRQVSGRSVILEADAYPFRGFAAVATATTNARGEFNTLVRPAANTRYRATAASGSTARSNEVLIFVRMKASLRVSDAFPERGERVQFFGSVTPAHDGLQVRIQKRNPDGSYRNVARAPLTAGSGVSSRFEGRIPIYRNGWYRVLVPSQDDHTKAVSPPRLVRVTS